MTSPVSLGCVLAPFLIFSNVKNGSLANSSIPQLHVLSFKMKFQVLENKQFHQLRCLLGFSKSGDHFKNIVVIFIHKVHIELSGD